MAGLFDKKVETYLQARPTYPSEWYSMLAACTSNSQAGIGIIHYVHTPQSMSMDEMVALMGGENHVDLITVATAMHWFDLPVFYKLAKRRLCKPGGILAIYNDMVLSPKFHTISKCPHEKSSHFWHAGAKYVIDWYRNLPFPFESVGLGYEGKPMQLEIPKELCSKTFALAKEQGLDLLSREVIKELESSWRGPNKVRTVIYKSFMLVGTV
ncbi:hypothetical protein ACJRO7_033824 [Eucalyptus globulus]|uniref:Methyltransferase type 11 domain-containing protein n=1 Tax=Eucalyptus globulus TaxID=34317 RepID=A0ABD3J4C2_EUCGL